MSGGGRVVIVGGGVIGLSCAYYLERAGYAVTVIDQDKIGQACSRSNCGYICPCHVLPLNEPGAVRTGLQSLFRLNSPFRINPGWDPALWRWLLQFARRCRHDYMLTAGKALRAILDASMEGYRTLMDTEKFDCEWREEGLLYLLRTPAGLEAMARTDDLLSREFGIRARRMDAAELHEFDPGYRPDLAGAFLYDHDACLNPERFNTALRARLEERGVTLVEQCALKEVRKESGKVAGLVTTRGDLAADHLVLAAGAWSSRWQEALEVKLPIQPGKGYSMTLDRPDPAPRIPALLPEHRVGISPFEDGLRVGSIMEIGGYDPRIPERRLKLLRASADLYLSQPLPASERETWFGWRPLTYDSLPIIGPAPRLSNVTLAVGHGMLGMTLAPATGRLVAELVAGDRPHLDPLPYSPARFR